MEDSLVSWKQRYGAVLEIEQSRYYCSNEKCERERMV